MKTCAFIGPRIAEVDIFGDKLLQILTDLIESEGVTQFYSLYRGTFDEYCSRLIHGLKSKYPQIKNVLAVPYNSQARCNGEQKVVLPEFFDDCVYLPKRTAPYDPAIIDENKCLIDLVDFVDCGVATAVAPIGGIYQACVYAQRNDKPVCNMFFGWNVFDKTQRN